MDKALALQCSHPQATHFQARANSAQVWISPDGGLADDYVALTKVVTVPQPTCKSCQGKLKALPQLCCVCTGSCICVISSETSLAGAAPFIQHRGRHRRTARSLCALPQRPGVCTAHRQAQAFLHGFGRPFGGIWNVRMLHQSFTHVLRPASLMAFGMMDSLVSWHDVH